MAVELQQVTPVDVTGAFTGTPIYQSVSVAPPASVTSTPENQEQPLMIAGINLKNPKLILIIIFVAFIVAVYFKRKA